MYTFAIGIAVVAALCLAVGTHLQHRAVAGAAVAGATAPTAPTSPIGPRRTAPGVPPPPRRLAHLLRSPLWLLGLALLTLETGLNMVALGLAPVALVQPIGTLSLVVAVVLGSWASRSSSQSSSPRSRLPRRTGRVRSSRTPTPRVLGGIGLTILSTGLFVGISAQWSTSPEAAAPELLVLAFLLLGIAGLGAVVALSAVGHAARVVTAGVLFGLVATGAHALLHALFGAGAGNGSGAGAGSGSGTDFGTEIGTGTEIGAGIGTEIGALLDSIAPVHAVLMIGLLAGSVVGMWIVQTAYVSGPPETVLAGLTVIDPLTAVLVGAAVLGEYTAMPLPVVLTLLLTGASAVAGVLLLVRVHPAVMRAEPRQASTDPSPALHGARLTDTRE